jgi:hypothetical protein
MSKGATDPPPEQAYRLQEGSNCNRDRFPSSAGLILIVEQGYQTAPGLPVPMALLAIDWTPTAWVPTAWVPTDSVPTAWVPTALLLPIASLPTSLGARAAAAAPTRHPGADGRGSARTSCVAAVEEP